MSGLPNGSDSVKNESSPLLDSIETKRGSVISSTAELYGGISDEESAEYFAAQPDNAGTVEPLYRYSRDDHKMGVVDTMFYLLNKMIGTGIFSTPSGIYALTGSVGGSLVLWILGGLLSYTGLSVLLEFGLEIPRSGGEKNYLQRVYKKPRHFTISVLAVMFVLFGLSSGNSYAFGVYILFVFGVTEPSLFLTRFMACVCISTAVILHGFFPRTGRAIVNTLGIFKVLVLLVIVGCGVGVVTGLIQLEDRPDNFSNLFTNDGFGGGIYNYSIALLRVFYSYKGWDNANYVMGQIKQPARTVPLAGTVALSLATVLYTLCNVAYFAVISKTEIAHSGVIVAGTFFHHIFGDSLGSWLLPLFVCLSNLGNVLVVSLSCGTLNNELGRDHVLPFSSFFASLRPVGTPLSGLMLHWFMTVLVIIVPPRGQIYEFIVDMSSYPSAITSVLLAGGLIYLKFNSTKENWGTLRLNSYKAPIALCIIYFTVNVYLVIMPLIPPPSSLKVPGSLPYYAAPMASFVVLFLGIAYWLYWRHSDGAKKLQLKQEEAGW